MKSKANSFKSILVLIVAIGGLVYFYDYVKIIVHSILGFFGLLFALFILFLLIYGLYSVTKKWLTVGLDNNEKNIAVVILAIIVFGSLFYGIVQLHSYYNEEIDTAIFFVIKMFVGTILIGFLPLLSYNAITRKKTPNIQDLHKYMLIVGGISLILSIVINHLFGEIIILWFENNWYFLFGGMILVLLVFNFVQNKKNNPTPK